MGASPKIGYQIIAGAWKLMLMSITMNEKMGELQKESKWYKVLLQRIQKDHDHLVNKRMDKVGSYLANYSKFPER